DGRDGREEDGVNPPDRIPRAEHEDDSRARERARGHHREGADLEGPPQRRRPDESRRDEEPGEDDIHDEGAEQDGGRRWPGEVNEWERWAHSSRPPWAQPRHLRVRMCTWGASSTRCHTNWHESLSVSSSGPPVKMGGAADDVGLALEPVAVGGDRVLQVVD